MNQPTQSQAFIVPTCKHLAILTWEWGNLGIDAPVQMSIKHVNVNYISKQQLHLFMLQNPGISVTKADADKLNYITYIGSGFSAPFALISLFIYIYLQ